MLTVLETTRRLRFTSGGRLLPWLGPALRGLASARLKHHVCRFPAPERPTYCRGCPHQAACGHARLFEPQPPPGARVLVGQEDAVRPLVIDAAFPAPPFAVPQRELTVRVLFVGSAAEDALAFWEGLAEAGADPQAGLGPDHAAFVVRPADAPDRCDGVLLPLEAPGRPRRLRVELTSPLLVRTAGPGGRRLVRRPSFADLFGACLRTLGPLCRLYGRPLPDETFRRLKELAAAVRTVRAGFFPDEQWKSSSRRGESGAVSGVVGCGVYADVPAVLQPWLTWGGRLHVGTHRVAGAGAGGWRVVLEEDHPSFVEDRQTQPAAGRPRDTAKLAVRSPR